MIEMELIAVEKAGLATEYRLSPNPVVIGAVGDHYAEMLHLTLPAAMSEKTVRVTFTPDMETGKGYLLDADRCVPITAAVTTAADHGVITVELMEPVEVDGETVTGMKFSRDVPYRAIPHAPAGEEPTEISQSQFEQFVATVGGFSAAAQQAQTVADEARGEAVLSAEAAAASEQSAEASAGMAATSSISAQNASISATGSADEAAASARAAANHAESAAASAKAVIDSTEQTYNPQSQNPQSGVAVAEAIQPIQIKASGAYDVATTALSQASTANAYTDEKLTEAKTYIDNSLASLEWKTLLDVTLTEEQAGASELLLAIPDAAALANARMVFIHASAPATTALAANAAWFTGTIKDAAGTGYNIQWLGGYNQAWGANTTITFLSKMFICNRQEKQGSYLVKTYQTHFHRPNCNISAPGNTIGIQGATMGYYAYDLMSHDRYAPYISLVCTTNNFTFEAGTRVFLEVC